MFSRFFSQVAELWSPTETIHLKGQPSRLRSLTLQETIGISDREADLLKTVALRCEKELRSIEQSARTVTPSARLDSIDRLSESKQYSILLLNATKLSPRRSAPSMLRWDYSASMFWRASYSMVRPRRITSSSIAVAAVRAVFQRRIVDGNAIERAAS